jgi:hypothetical protein
MYWLAEYVHFYTLHVISVAVFIATGFAFRLQFFTLTAPGVRTNRETDSVCVCVCVYVYVCQYVHVHVFACEGRKDREKRHMGLTRTLYLSLRSAPSRLSPLPLYIYLSTYLCISYKLGVSAHVLFVGPRANRHGLLYVSLLQPLPQCPLYAT